MRTGLPKQKLSKKQNVDESFVSVKAGLPPGSLIYVGSTKTPAEILTVFNFSDQHFEERVIKDVNQYAGLKHDRGNIWINFDGIDHVKEVEKLGREFGLHILVMEDIVNSNQRPRLEPHDEYIFMTLKMMSMAQKGREEVIVLEQVSFLLGKNWLLSFQEDVGDVFEEIRKRLRDAKTNVRKNAIDYLFYRLVDTVVDNYFIIAEHISNSIEELEEEIMQNPSADLRWKMQKMRKEIILLRKAVTPLREAIGKLAKEDNKFIKKATLKYFHDVYDHIIHLNDFIDTQRDLLSSLVELYLSGVSFKMNQVIKVLTIISTIFIPLTFVAGIYGMNFDNMPELRWHYGYYVILGLMFVMVAGMLYYFRKKEWL